MIQALGFKRVATLAAFAGLLILIYALNAFFLKSQTEKSFRDLNAVRGEIGTLRAELEKLQSDYALYEKEKATYEKITRMGFFQPQDRVTARQRLDTIQRMSKIISARYEIKAATASAIVRPGDLTNPVQPQEGVIDAAAADFVMIESPMTVTLSAIDDVDIYRFMYYMNYGFPGHITMNKISMQKTGQVTPDVLKSIGTGAPPPLVSASVEMTWRSMIPRDVMENSADLKVLNAGVSQ